jgi:hypothetical protein
MATSSGVRVGVEERCVVWMEVVLDGWRSNGNEFRVGGEAGRRRLELPPTRRRNDNEFRVRMEASRR